MVILIWPHFYCFSLPFFGRHPLQHLLQGAFLIDLCNFIPVLFFEVFCWFIVTRLVIVKFLTGNSRFKITGRWRVTVVRRMLRAAIMNVKVQSSKNYSFYLFTFENLSQWQNFTAANDQRLSICNFRTEKRQEIDFEIQTWQVLSINISLELHDIWPISSETFFCQT